MVEMLQLGRRRRLEILFISAFLARMLVAPFTRHEWDMMVWTRVGREFLQEGITPYRVLLQTAQSTGRFYYYYAYPPIWFTSIVQSYFLFELSSFHSTGALYTWIKLPLILTDLVVGYLIYDYLLPKVGRERATWGSAAYLLNPYILWISSVWTMHDCIAACFTLLSYRLFIEEKRRASALCLGTAIATKIYPIFALPVFLHRIEGKRGRISFLVLVVLVPLLVSLPFLFEDLKAYIFMFQFHLQRKPTGVTYWEISRVVHKLRVPYRLRLEYEHIAGDLAKLAFPLSVGFFSVLLERTKEIEWSQDKLLTALVSGCLIYFFTMKNVHPPFLVWIAPLMVILAYGTKGNKRGSIYYWLLSSLFFLYFSINEPISAFWGESMPDYYYDNIYFRLSLWAVGTSAALVEIAYFKSLIERLKG